MSAGGLAAMCAVLVFVAVLVEFIVEGIKGFLPEWAQSWLVAFVVSAAICLSRGIGLINVAVDSLAPAGMGTAMPFWLDAILTAAVICRGSAALHEFFKKAGVIRAPDSVATSNGEDT